MDVRLLLLLFAQILQSICLDNLALNKAASQSSNLHADKWLADEAVDGDGNQKLAGNSCACTSDYFFPAAWWQVNLGKVYAMSKVKIFYRSETGDNTYTFKLSGFILYVNLDDDFLSKTPVYVNNGGVQTNPGPPANFTVTLAAYGQYVTLYKERRDTCPPGITNSNFCTRFEFCEVEGLGCPQKKHGSDCQSDCPENCLYDVCKISDGKCFACKVGYNGEMCDQPCPSGTYGAGCSQTCSGRCKNSAPCDVTDGMCPEGCSDGYVGSYCNITCNPGSFGASCSSSCGSCRDSVTCNFINGTCPTGCGLGVMGQYCKTACPSGTYGAGCSQTCSGHCKNSAQCDVTDGTCPNGCSDGYLGSYCNITCNPGSFGASCSSSCGSCRDSATCNFINGTCPTGCGLGVMGQYCKTACSSGMYGYSCSESCSGNCYNGVTCNVQTGKCDGGCAAGWRGDKCDTACTSGTFGRDCLQSCSGNCQNETGCNIVDGSCQYECKGGWKGHICSQVCEDGTYGSGCVESCGNCINSTVCDRQTGVCDSGCADGYINSLCKEKCPAGFYGTRCSLECPRCESTCDHVTGGCPENNSEQKGPEDADAFCGLTFTIYGVISGTVIVGLVIAVILLCIKIQRNNKQVNQNKYSNQLAPEKGKTLRGGRNNAEDENEKQKPEVLYTEAKDINEYEELRRGAMEMREYEALQGGSVPSSVQSKEKKNEQVSDRQVGDKGGATNYEELKDIRLDNMYEPLKNTSDATYTNTQLR